LQQTKITYNGYFVYFHPFVSHSSHLFFGLHVIF
jgi:hypothetical protein